MTEQIETALSEKGAFGMGNLRYAYILNALRDWAGDEAEIREVGCQFRAINQKNDVLTVTGTVKEKKVEDGENLSRPLHLSRSIRFAVLSTAAQDFS